MPELIDKEKLLLVLEQTETSGQTDAENKAIFATLEYCRQIIEEQPTIEPEVLIIPKEVSATDIDKLTEMIKGSLLQAYPNDAMFTAVRHGRWIECDYKHLEHGFMETEPKAGLCCSECRTAFQKKKMTYKQYCAACGARMDGGA